MLVQKSVSPRPVNQCGQIGTPRNIVQFWHSLEDLPDDVQQCIASWRHCSKKGFAHRLFDESSARAFIRSALGQRYERAFRKCYHPAMQSDYFRLCYIFIEGGFYVDADDICLNVEIESLFEDGRLKIQPLCYDTATGTMVSPSEFLSPNAHNPNWIHYFNNNPLIAGRRHPVLELALEYATELLELASDESLPEIQATTGPGNLSKAIFNLAAVSPSAEWALMVLREWDSFAVSKWPLSYRVDARNWRLSNQKRFHWAKDLAQ